jgi:hypothetical protein
MISFTRRSGYAVEHILPQHLLKAALLQDERAIQAWRAWKSMVDEDNLDEGSHRLLPLLHQNLSRLGVNQEEIKKYTQVFRFYWYKNQLIVSKAMPILSALNQAGIEYLFLKGIPLAFHCYPNPGLRPFADVDILVKPEDALQAYALLKQYDLTPLLNYPEEKLLQLRHAQGFRATAGLMIDLHWRLLYRNWDNQSPLVFWENTIAFQFGAHTANTISISAHLMHVCLHGLDWSFIAPIRWAADAAILLRNHTDQIDWDWILHQTQNRRLTTQLNRQLDYLRNEFDLPIPHQVFQRLAAAKRWRWEKLETRLATHPPNILRKLLGFWFSHYRSHPNTSLWRRLATFPQFLFDILNITHTKNIFPTLLTKLREWV